jgi:hypothetical protein
VQRDLRKIEAPLRVAATASAFVAALACAPVQVETRLEPGADPARFATFAHGSLADDDSRDAAEAGMTEISAPRIRAEIEEALEARGYRQAPLDEADMVVSHLVDAAWSVQMRNAGQPEADYYVPVKVLEGRIQIDVYRAADMSRLWHGVGETDVPPGTDPNWAASQVVEAILEKFPARAADRP